MGLQSLLAKTIVVAILFCDVIGAQVVRLGTCQAERSSTEFTQRYVESMKGKDYVLALSSGPSYDCQRVKFVDDKTFFHTYIRFNIPRNSSGNYQTTTPTLSNPARITMRRLKDGDLGADMDGVARFNVLVAKPNELVLSSCYEIGAIRVDQVLVFVPASKYRKANVPELKESMLRQNVRHADIMREIEQTCSINTRTSDDPIRVYDFLMKVGILPQFDNRVDNVRIMSTGGNPGYSGYPGSPQPTVLQYRLPTGALVNYQMPFGYSDNQFSRFGSSQSYNNNYRYDNNNYNYMNNNPRVVPYSGSQQFNSFQSQMQPSMNMNRYNNQYSSYPLNHFNTQNWQQSNTGSFPSYNPEASKLSSMHMSSPMSMPMHMSSPMQMSQLMSSSMPFNSQNSNFRTGYNFNQFQQREQPFSPYFGGNRNYPSLYNAGMQYVDLPTAKRPSL